MRERYQEPAWNYQVVRVVDERGEDLIPRVEKDWTVAAVAEAMLAGLKTAGAEQPEWLRLLAAEERALARGVESAIFGMS